jgi:predicted small secreted protein
MKKMLIPIAMLIVISLSGCETMEGLGRDLQNLGDSIEEKSSDDE